MKRRTTVVAIGIVSAASLSALARAGFADSKTVSDDPQPAPITILTSSPAVARGLIFVTPAGGSAPPLTNPDAGVPGSGGAPPAAVSKQGPEIVDNQGRPVWFEQLPSGIGATDFRVQTYRGEPVLTWIQSAGGFSTGPTTDYIADRHYHTIASVTAGNGLIADTHEFRLTREGTALISVYRTIPYDLSPVGGPADGLVTEGVVQELDVASGKVLFEWHSLDHVGIDESHEPPPTSATSAYDYFHLNSVNPDVDGNLLISSRHTWTVYKLDRHTGAVIWRLGGKKSDFDLGPDVAFAWQHNPLVADDSGRTIRIFDNESAGTSVLPYSRVIWIRHDDVRKTATLERWFKHPDNLSAASQGNSQALDNGDTFVGWGQVGRYSEFDPNGNLLLDAAFAPSYDTYRAYRHEWIGEPDTIPAVTASVSGNAATVHAIWNGATEVARWEILGGPGQDSLRRVGVTDWNGLDTVTTVEGNPAYVQVVAEDRYGRELGRSEVTASGS